MPVPSCSIALDGGIPCGPAFGAPWFKNRLDSSLSSDTIISCVYSSRSSPSRSQPRAARRRRPVHSYLPEFDAPDTEAITVGHASAGVECGTVFLPAQLWPHRIHRHVDLDRPGARIVRGASHEPRQLTRHEHSADPTPARGCGCRAGCHPQRTADRLGGAQVADAIATELTVAARRCRPETAPRY